MRQSLSKSVSTTARTWDVWRVPVVELWHTIRYQFKDTMTYWTAGTFIINCQEKASVYLSCSCHIAWLYYVKSKLLPDSCRMVIASALLDCSLFSFSSIVVCKIQHIIFLWPIWLKSTGSLSMIGRTETRALSPHAIILSWCVWCAWLLYAGLLSLEGYWLWSPRWFPQSVAQQELKNKILSWQQHVSTSQDAPPIMIRWGAWRME